jgi:ATP-dependent DNA helicase RecG
MEFLSLPLDKIKYIGKVYQKRLQKLGIKTLKDLFYHFPHRYDDFSNLKKISQVKIGEEVAIQGKIKAISARTSPKKRIILTEAIIQDESGILKAVWFNQPFIEKNLKVGDNISFAGEVKSKGGEIFLSNPTYEKIKEGRLLHTLGLVPIYPETKGLSSRWLRNILNLLFEKYLSQFEEFLPREILKSEGFPEIKKAIFDIHFPKTKEDAKKAKDRFAFEEIFLIQLVLQKQRLKLERRLAPKILPYPEEIQIFKKSLPFELTEDQKKALREIFADLQKTSPMSRLLEGEVGSGKTIVAIFASYIVVKNGYQVAVMAPTGILAEQHFSEFKKRLKNLKNYSERRIKIGLLTSELAFLTWEGKISQRKLLKKTFEGEVDILIGTHSLIQERVKFKKLGLVIVDEQHRFGVEQRAKLCAKGNESFIPHFLSMTATPIPRTLALAFYGDLSISQIKELPKGRKEVKIKIIPPSKRREVYEFLRSEINQGRQAFIICPLVEESPNLEAKAAKKEYERIKRRVFPEFKVGLLHGKMKEEEKCEVMRNFLAKKIQILVATPVVEVGVDVSNATVMIIEGAERFGLAQLYQLKGRVGRGNFPGFCFLFTESEGAKTWQRLKALLSSKNAFEVAEYDLKIRGPGDFIGKRQAGIPDTVMEALTNLPILEKAKKWAIETLRKDPELKNFPYLAREVEKIKEKFSLG